MNGRLIKRLCLVTVVGALCIGMWYGYRFQANSGVLWNIVSRQCVPHLQMNHDPKPCYQVNLRQGYALLKDKVGIAQYLLIPTAKVSGIESPLLLQAQTPNYFWLAWSALPLLSQTLAKPVPNTLLSLAINAKWGRSQNQLHIHMSCLRADIAEQLAEKRATLTDQWQQYSLLHHKYWIRTITLEQLHSESLFQRIAVELPDITIGKGEAGVAVSMLADGRVVVMVLKTNWLKGVLGSAEELQDHQCRAVLGTTAAKLR